MKNCGKQISAEKNAEWVCWPVLVFLTVCLLVGAMIGFAVAVTSETDEMLKDHLRLFLEQFHCVNFKPSFLSVVWDCFRWPVLAISFSFLGLGVVGLPLLLFVRGFVLTYSATCFAAAFGLGGAASAAVLLSSAALLGVPVLLILSCEGFRVSARRFIGSVKSEPGYRVEVCLPGVGLVFLAMAMQWAVVPTLLSAIII
jgi:hypothetical protein